MARTRTLINTGGTTWDVSKLGIATPIPATVGTLDIKDIFTDAEIADLLQRGDLVLSATHALQVELPAGGTVDLIASTDFGMASDYLMQHRLFSTSGGANKVPVTDGSGDLDIGARFFLSSGVPTTGSQVVNKTYVDSVAQGLYPHTAVNLATAAALPSCTAAGTGVGKTLTGNAFGALLIDGQAASGRVLIQNQVAAKDNGIYDVTNPGGPAAYFVLTRASDFDASVTGEVKCGAFMLTTNGDTNNNFRFVLVTPNPIAVDVDALTFTKLSGPDEMEAGNGINISDGVITTKLGEGLEYGSGGDSDKNQVKRDVTTGATIAPVAVGAAGVGVTVDNDTIKHSTGTLSVDRVPTKGQRGTFLFSRQNAVPDDSYLRSAAGIFANVASPRMIRAGKIVGISVQVGTSPGTSMDFEVWKNGTAIIHATAVVPLANPANGNVVDSGIKAAATFAKGDTLQVYANNLVGASPADVVVLVEYELTA